MLTPMRVEPKPPLKNDVLRQDLVAFLEINSFFQVTVKAGDVVGQGPVDCFVIFYGVENLPIQIPVPEFSLKLLLSKWV